MCFNKTKESKLLIAKRDITVYKIGCYANEVIFNPYYMTNYKYNRKTLIHEYVEFDKDSINIGLHSLLSLSGVYNLMEGYMCFFPNGNIVPFITTNILYNPIYVGKFIIPKGSTYIVNFYNEVVSDALIYTGKFKYINKNENFNVKDLWKEN